MFDDDSSALVVMVTAEELLELIVDITEEGIVDIVFDCVDCVDECVVRVK